MKNFKHGKSIMYAYAGVALPAIVALFLYPSLIRNLGLERFGALTLALTIALFFSNFDFGVGLTVTRYVARISGRANSEGIVRRLVRHAAILQICIGVMIALGLLGIQTLWGFLGSTSSAELIREFDRASLWLALSIPLALIAGVLRCALEGAGRYGIANALRAPASIAVFAAPMGFSFLTNRIDILMLSMLIIRAISALVFLMFWTSIVKAPTTKSANFVNFFRHSRVLIAYGGWVMIGTAAGGLMVLGVLDRFLIARFLDLVSVIQYSIPSDVVVRCLLIPSAIASVFITILSRTVVANPQLVPEVHRRALNITAGQVGPIVALLLTHAEWLLAMLTDQPASATSVMIVQGLATGYFIHSLAHIPYCGLHAAGKPRAASTRSIVQLPVYAAGSSFLLLTGHIDWLGWMWCAWALIDLIMLFVLHQRHVPEQRAFDGIYSPTILLWAVIIGLSILFSLVYLPSIFIIILSLLVCAIFCWNLFRLATSRAILE